MPAKETLPKLPLEPFEAIHERSAVPMRCPHCGQHFSPEGRFCPFDREPLVLATDWDPKDDPLLGTTIDARYEVEALIGEGGMGRVYRVRHALLGKHFALKALRQDLANDREIAERFIHEARTAASVAHPGLVQISDFGHLASGQAFFVMELLAGIPLSSLLRRHGALSPGDTVSIASKIAEALGAAHRAGVVHRDLKPDNIHVHVEGGRHIVKIVDFGLAKVIGASRLTQDGIVFGTPYYMSPEQAAGEPIDARADIYALGVVLYEMLTGRVPFEADTYMGVLSKHIYVKPVPPSVVLGVPGLLGPLEAIVLRCLEKNREARYPDLGVVSGALRAIPPAFLEGLRTRLPHTPVIASGSGEELVSAAFSRSPGGLGLPRIAIGIGLVVACAGLGSLIVINATAPSGEKATSALPSGVEPKSSTKEPFHANLGASKSKPAEPASEPAPSARRPSTAPARRAMPARSARSAKPRAPEIIYPWAK